MKHTPGPWKICDDGINVYAEPDIAITNQDHPCAPDQDEAEANARLIASAPELLDICKDLIALYVNTNSHDPMFVKKGLSIISKIEGRT
ncbi:MAG: hypothetical protein IMZ43_12240 [Thermoplasmata archaeon]|nr:hypothetical protein [Thermoplasmata archaeon]